MFVRLKKIKSKEYGYLVSNEWTKKGPRQKTQAYLGRVFLLGKIDEDKLKLPANVNEMKFSELVNWMILHNLRLVGFEPREGKLWKGDLVYDDKEHEFFYRERKSCVKLNEGILCKHTIESLRDFEKTGENRRDIILFAETVVSAGIKLTKDVFVKLYTKLPVKEMEEQKLSEFEY